MCTLVIAEIASTVGLAHISLVMLLLYSKMCINSIKFHRKPISDETVIQRLRWRKHKNYLTEETKPKILHGLSDLDLYSILTVQFRLVRHYLDIAAVFIMGPGFLIVVIANYVAIMLHIWKVTITSISCHIHSSRPRPDPYHGRTSTS